MIPQILIATAVLLIAASFALALRRHNRARRLRQNFRNAIEGKETPAISQSNRAGAVSPETRSVGQADRKSGAPYGQEAA